MIALAFANKCTSKPRLTSSFTRLSNTTAAKTIIEKVKKYRIRAIFAETTLPRKAADVIAKEAGVKVLLLNPEGGENESYIDFMRNNFATMKEAMQ